MCQRFNNQDYDHDPTLKQSFKTPSSQFIVSLRDFCLLINACTRRCCKALLCDKGKRKCFEIKKCHTVKVPASKIKQLCFTSFSFTYSACHAPRLSHFVIVLLLNGNSPSDKRDNLLLFLQSE